MKNAQNCEWTFHRKSLSTCAILEDTDDQDYLCQHYLKWSVYDFGQEKRETNLRYGWYFVGKASKTSCENENTYLKPIRIEQLMGEVFSKLMYLCSIVHLVFWYFECWHYCFGMSIWNCMFYVLKGVNVICYFTTCLRCCYDSCCHQRWVNLFLVVNKHEFGKHNNFDICLSWNRISIRLNISRCRKCQIWTQDISCICKNGFKNIVLLFTNLEILVPDETGHIWVLCNR